MREIDSVLVVGKSEPQRIFELMGRKGELDATRQALRAHFGAALEAYRHQDWTGARAEFDACLELVPDDGPAQVFHDRIERLRAAPPGPSWNGVWSMTTK